MKKILLIGGGGHCRACIDVLEQEARYTIAGIIDTALFDANVSEVMGYPILGGDDALESLRRHYTHALITIGQITTPTPRKRIFTLLKSLDFCLPTIISPLAYVARGVELGEGSIIMHHALINSNAQIHKACIINSKALIEHDCIIEDFCHLSTGSIINGGCHIGAESFIGSGTILKHATTLPPRQVLFGTRSFGSH